MSKNLLTLEVPDVMTDCILKIEDLSWYDQLLQYSCPTVQILAPGFTQCVTFNDTTEPTVFKNFAFNLTACDLGLQIDQCGLEFAIIPDGVYGIKYSISPNDLQYVEINHLRVTSLRKRLKQAWVKLDLGACQPPDQVQKQFDMLMQITGYIDAAKASVEVNLDYNKGMYLYNWAKKLMDKAECKNC